MRIIVGCEFSGTVRRAFQALGHHAVSCDLLPAEDGSPDHIVGNVLDVLADGWDLAIFHPPCTRLTVAGARWFKGKEQEQADAIAFAEDLWNAPIPRIAIENPIGVLSTRSTLGKPSQIIQPWQFGHDASKATCLWLKGLPSLRPTNVLPGGKQARRANQTASGQNRLAPSPDRWKLRSMTYEGIAAAMADQWSSPYELELTA